VASEQPINAGVPAAKPTAKPPQAPPGSPAATPPREDASRPPSARKKRPVGIAIALAGLAALALGLIVVAVLAGRGSDERHEVVGEPERAPLAYPSLATSNTTRVEGADPVARAAAVALAAYPSTSPAQRPSAVALVNADDWRTAIAASVLMAAPVGAPLLVSEADGVPGSTSAALDALDPGGDGATHRVQAFAIAGASTPGEFRTRRIGATGIVGAASVAKVRDRLFGSPPKHIVVASADRPAFAMPAAAWAARSGDPILFTPRNRLAAPTAAALKRHRGAPVYVLGPSAVISSRVVREIAKIAGPVRRVSDEDPIGNAIALARYADGDFGWNLNDPGHGFVVARASSPLDAAAAAPLSASGTWGPLLLTSDGDTLPAALRGYLLDVKPGYTTDPTRAFYNHVWVIGDQEAIDVKQQAQIDELAELTKIGGGS
jgi:Cell wall binding domain 2 (CWB2)